MSITFSCRSLHVEELVQRPLQQPLKHAYEARISNDPGWDPSMIHSVSIPLARKVGELCLAYSSHLSISLPSCRPRPFPPTGAVLIGHWEGKEGARMQDSFAAPHPSLASSRSATRQLTLPRFCPSLPIVQDKSHAHEVAYCYFGLATDTRRPPGLCNLTAHFTTLQSREQGQSRCLSSPCCGMMTLLAALSVRMHQASPTTALFVVEASLDDRDAPSTAW